MFEWNDFECFILEKRNAGTVFYSTITPLYIQNGIVVVVVFTECVKYVIYYACGKKN